MIGFCKCDICGKIYHRGENKNYDGLMVWYFDKETDTTMHGDRKYDIIEPKWRNNERISRDDGCMSYLLWTVL